MTSYSGGLVANWNAVLQRDLNLIDLSNVVCARQNLGVVAMNFTNITNPALALQNLGLTGTLTFGTGLTPLPNSYFPTAPSSVSVDPAAVVFYSPAGSHNLSGINNLSTSNISVSQTLTATTGAIPTLTSSTATITNLTSPSASITTLAATTASVSGITTLNTLNAGGPTSLQTLVATATTLGSLQVQGPAVSLVATPRWSYVIPFGEYPLANCNYNDIFRSPISVDLNSTTPTGLWPTGTYFVSFTLTTNNPSAFVLSYPGEMFLSSLVNYDQLSPTGLYDVCWSGLIDSTSGSAMKIRSSYPIIPVAGTQMLPLPTDMFYKGTFSGILLSEQVPVNNQAYIKGIGVNNFAYYHNNNGRGGGYGNAPGNNYFNIPQFVYPNKILGTNVFDGTGTIPYYGTTYGGRTGVMTTQAGTYYIQAGLGAGNPPQNHFFVFSENTWAAGTQYEFGSAGNFTGYVYVPAGALWTFYHSSSSGSDGWGGTILTGTWLGPTQLPIAGIQVVI